MSALVAKFSDGRYRSFLTWVLRENPATRFYERLEGERLGSAELTIEGRALTELAYGWKSLPIRFG